MSAVPMRRLLAQIPGEFCIVSIWMPGCMPDGDSFGSSDSTHAQGLPARTTDNHALRYHGLPPVQLGLSLVNGKSREAEGPGLHGLSRFSSGGNYLADSLQQGDRAVVKHLMKKKCGMITDRGRIECFAA